MHLKIQAMDLNGRILDQVFSFYFCHKTLFCHSATVHFLIFTNIVNEESSLNY